MICEPVMTSQTHNVWPNKVTMDHYVTYFDLLLDKGCMIMYVYGYSISGTQHTACHRSTPAKLSCITTTLVKLHSTRWNWLSNVLFTIYNAVQQLYNQCSNTQQWLREIDSNRWTNLSTTWTICQRTLLSCEHILRINIFIDTQNALL